ncbi:MAG: hypothetical protein A2341_22540 [Deltaproteobacteria bacterium RIFOXYB12_FULL_58_9]|nr:MAG: hypothetical protein A2341_22540 [Deltaproteobacteria bacterium RIFOXYB12_FULL_58_9]
MPAEEPIGGNLLDGTWRGPRLGNWPGLLNSRVHAMATLRNVAISVLRLAGVENIAAATRYLGRQVERPLRLLGLA